MVGPYVCYAPPCFNYNFRGRIFLDLVFPSRIPPPTFPPPIVGGPTTRVEGYIERFEVQLAFEIVVAYYLVDDAGVTYELPANFHGRILEFYDSQARVAAMGRSPPVVCFQAPCPDHTFCPRWRRGRRY